MQYELEGEYRLFEKAGGDADRLRAMDLDVFQVMEARKGLEDGVDIEKYLDASIPWPQMEEIRLELKENLDLSDYRNAGFDWTQLEEIRLGLEAGIDVTAYTKIEYLSAQMKEIRLGLMARVPVSLYSNPLYDWFQMGEIRQGLESGVDISVYAGTDIPYLKMREIRKALEAGMDMEGLTELEPKVLAQLRLAFLYNIDLKPYIQAGYAADQLEQIRIALESKIDLSPYLRTEFMGEAIKEIRLGLEEGLDVGIYAKIEYGWRQMCEIRLGLENRIEVTEYCKSLYSWKQMKEIRLGLEAGVDISLYASLMYTHSDMARIRSNLENQIEEGGITRKNKILYTKLGNKVSITDDGMTAYLELFPPIEHDYKVSDVHSYLTSEGITCGVDNDAIERIISQKLYGIPVIVARGRMPKKGEDGFYEYFFRTDFPRIPKELPDGSVDYQNIDYFEQVSTGQTLAVYHAAKPGIPGYDVTGNTLAASKGLEKPVLRGKGFLLSEDKRTYVAALTGRIELNGYELIIYRLMTVGNVTLSTGNIRFAGDVYVRGYVGAGVVLEAAGDIAIDGNVEGAYIKSGRNVILKSGVTGGGTAYIEAGENISGKFMEASTLLAGKSIQANYCMNCNITAKERVIISGYKGILLGGITRASQGVIAHSIGNSAQLPTLLDLGINKIILEQYYNSRKAILKIQEELKIFFQNKIKFEGRYPKDHLVTLDIYQIIMQAIRIKEKEMSEGLNKHRELEEEIHSMEGAQAVVNGSIYPEVTVCIDQISLTIKNKVSNVTLRRVDNRIAAYTN